jgi:hypothetical protein
MGGLSSKQQFELVLNKLGTEDVDEDNTEFWDDLWKTSLNAKEIFEIAQPDVIRAIVQNKPRNLHSLFSQAVAQTFQVVETPYPVYFDQALNCTRVLARILPFIIESSDQGVHNMCWASLEAPLFSKEDKGSSKTSTRSSSPTGNETSSTQGADVDSSAEEQLQTSIAGTAERENLGKPDAETKDGVLAIALGDKGSACDHDGPAASSAATPDSKNDARVNSEQRACEDAAVSSPSSPSSSSVAASSRALSASCSGTPEPEEAALKHEREPLAVVLINSIFHMLFLPDFTIEDPNVDFREEDINSKEFKAALMWAPGVGSSEKSVTSSTQYDVNRIEVLRVLLAACCDPLFHSPDCFDSCDSLWLEVATSNDTPYSEIVLYSLLNTVLGYDPVGWGLPYGNLVTTDTAQPLMEVAVQVLIVLLDYGYPCNLAGSSGDQAASSAGSGSRAGAAAFSSSSALPKVDPDDTESPGFNVFRRALGSIEDPAQLNFIFRGFVRLLNNIPQSDRSYLPFSHNRVTCEQELLVLLWKCLEEIPRFLPYVLRHCEVTQLLVPLCYLMVEGRRDPARVGLIYLCTFTILKLSGERNFGVALNKEYTLELPVDVPLFTGTHADLLVVTIHKLVTDGHEKLTTLHNCFLTIICNVSPYCKCLISSTSVKLLNLVSHFAAPRRLFGAETNYIYVVMLLETLNNILQYQYQGNVHVVYAILRLKVVFEGLAALDLQKALEGARGLRSPPAAAEGTRAGTGPASASTVLMDIQAMQRAPEGDVPSNAPASPLRENGSGMPAYWEPDQAWIERVRSELPLNTVLRLLKHLAPQVDELTISRADGVTVSHEQVLAFIRETTMVGLLPVPHPIVIRKYQPNKFTALWFSAFLWGVIVVRSRNPPLFDGKAVKLFVVQGEK